MNAIASLLLAAYLGTVMVQGNAGPLWEAAKVDAPSVIPWLIAVLVLVVVYQSRGFLGPANALVAVVIIATVVAALLLSSDAVGKAIGDIGSILKS